MSTESINIVCGGDVSFDLEIRQLWFLGAWKLKRASTSKQKRHTRNRILRKLSRIWDAVKISRKLDPHFPELLIKSKENKKKMELDRYSSLCIPFEIDFSSESDKFAYPFKKISSFLRSKDLVLVNLENPLTSNPRAHGLLIAEPVYAQAMADAGVSMVSLANNHIFDAGENGFSDTINWLNKAGILFVGAGENIEKTRLGTTIELKGTTINFLAYTQYCNHRFVSVAGNNYAGILPLDRQLIMDDIKRAREKADFVFPILHWGFENTHFIHPRQIEIAHLLIDAGADGIIGHHPHVPHGIEIYKGKPILYSLGNFIFAQSDVRWNCDNFLAEIVLDQKRIHGVKVYPISGQGKELFQPEVLNGSRADSFIYKLRKISSAFGTKIEIQNNVGYITVK